MAWSHWILVAGLVGTCAAKPAKAPKPKKGEPVVVAPTEGWITEEGATGACWVPPDFEALGAGERRMARNISMEAMKEQWTGLRNDGVSFDAGMIEGLETVLLGYPEKTEQVARDNAERCKAAMRGGGTEAWGTWLTTLPRTLTANECARPLDVTMFWYMDIGMGWQGPASVCAGDKLRIWSSERDYYKVDDGSAWINADGDRSKPATGEGYVCTTESCYAGQVVMRFRGQSGVELIKPVGLELLFTPPEHGQIEFTVNDTTYFNNVYKIERGLQHRTSVTYEPVQ